MDDRPAANFMGAWFHQDWVDEAPTWEIVVEDYRRCGVGADDVRSVCEDLARWLDEHPAEQHLDEPLLHELHCYYDPRADGMTAREWITRVVDRLRTGLERSGAP